MTTCSAKAIVLASIAIAVSSFSQQTYASDTPSASALLETAARTLSSARTLSADFEEDDTYPTPYKDLAQQGSVKLAKPGKLRIEVQRFRRVTAADPWKASGNDALSVSDGTTYSYEFIHPHSAQVRQQPSSSQALSEALKELPGLSAFFGEPALAANATLLPPETWEGASYQVVDYPAVAATRSLDTRVYIGKDGLVHRLVSRTDTPEGAVVKERILRNIRLDGAMADALFAFAPPAGATPLAAARPAAPQTAGLTTGVLVAGATAPDFAVTDAHGNTVKLSDYRGKTVILDFWATWCWPCNQSLPHTESVAEQNRDKNVVVLAVAIWDTQEGFDAWTSSHRYPAIDFAIDPSAQGKDIASTLYHVSATPTAFVIDPAGRIVSSMSGYTGPSDDLQLAINTAAGFKTASSGH